MDLVDARGLPASPLDAQAYFLAVIVPAVRACGHDCAVIFDPANHTHDSWRRAVVQELAREAVPLRVNAVVGTDKDAIAKVAEYLSGAPGVTGQVFTTNDGLEHPG